MTQKMLIAFIKKIPSNLRLTLLAFLAVIAVIYSLMYLFSPQVGYYVDHHEYLHFGFWGLGLMLVFFPSALLTNFLVTIYCSFRPIKRVRDLVYSTLISATMVGGGFWLYFVSDTGNTSSVLSFLTMVLWTAYFGFVPQAGLHSILPEGKARKGIWPRVYYVVPRLALVGLFAFLVLALHSELGHAFGITPD